MNDRSDLLLRAARPIEEGAKFAVAWAALWGFGSGRALLVEKRPFHRALWLALPLLAASIAHARRVVKERAV